MRSTDSVSQQNRILNEMFRPFQQSTPSLGFDAAKQPRMKLSKTTTLILLSVCISVSQAFFATGKARQPKVSPLAEEAVAIYNKKYPFGRDAPSFNPMGDFGMPTTDIDGTRIKAKNPSKKRLTDITEEEAVRAFSLLAQLYGDDRAIKMVKAQPICLAFDIKGFPACLDAWADAFGLEAAQDMVTRNPGLLAVRPDEAAKATDSTMAFSYIVAITRPAGPFLLAGTFFLLLTPFLEAVTGIQYGIGR